MTSRISLDTIILNLDHKITYLHLDTLFCKSMALKTQKLRARLSVQFFLKNIQNCECRENLFLKLCLDDLENVKQN
jgi:hypothetical protein